MCLPNSDLVWGVMPKRAAQESKVAFKLWLETISSESGLTSLLMPKKVLSIFETSEVLNPRCMKSPKPFAGAGKRGPSLKTLVGHPASAMTFKAVDGQLRSQMEQLYMVDMQHMQVEKKVMMRIGLRK